MTRPDKNTIARGVISHTVTADSITTASVKPGAFSSTLHDGRQAGIYGTSRYGRCKYGLPRRGIYDSDTYGNCAYS